ncbi:MAG: hypothetical protein EPN31_04900 [Castellaniella sp.]|uniref:hypothetical protein n=1 Tax=Castellaniella sp. TaxID=1955812 RepID=UPI001222FF41|nr:hypothetical protein [Castellaniella sp.]TAN29992.1 MAG: hypothetical protein EPN31_04900 [Castellaniella sp.]
MNTITEPLRAIKLFGTEEPVTAPRVLTAGPLTAEFDAGNLRHIRQGGVELIRAISFIVRDHNWGTYSPQIENLAIDERDGRFRVTYDACARDERQRLRFSAVIEGNAKTGLNFAVRGATETDFLTNRTGFVVLHPCALAGKPVTIEHTDGKVEEGQFPQEIDPLQPMMDLRCLTHSATPGLRVTCRMEGDTYEMEDQRNWTDASYKTYTRPLALPWPYTMRKGTAIEQSIRLSVTGSMPRRSSTDAVIPVTLKLGATEGTIPPLGLGLQPRDIADTCTHMDRLRKVGIGHIIGYYDPREGHDANTLHGLADAARKMGATPWLEAVVASVGGFAEELTRLGKMVEAQGSPFTTVLVSPAPDLKCTLPGSVWPPAPPPREFFAAARAAFPKARLGGGMFSLFTEMNRKRPPMDLIDFLSFTTTAMLHAGDDVSIMEGLESLPAMTLTASRIAGDKPWAVGPSAIGLRMNPYGDAPFGNPNNIRQAMNFNDPRHRALLGAGWAVGYFARFATGGASAITLGGATGPFGLLHTPQSWPQPWYDENPGGLFPMYHVLRGLAALHGTQRRTVSISEPAQVQAIAGRDQRGTTTVWLANITGQALTLRCECEVTDCVMLDETSFVLAARDPEAIDTLVRAGMHTLALAPYAIARLSTAA